ncbi:MAG: RNA polymerase sigma factor [Bacteroidales bacterium]|nr:RNA polymerase sigma factor [Bacteroidales bacterium]
MTVAEYNHAVNEYADRIFRFVVKNIRNESTAQDIIQDTYEKLWLKHEGINFSKVRSYLFTTAYHTMIDQTRRDRKTLDIEEAHPKASHPQDEPFDLKANLNRALDQIPEIQRNVILLRDYEGYSYDEIADITNLSESQVKVYIYRGRIALRKLIGSPEVLI